MGKFNAQTKSILNGLRFFSRGHFRGIRRAMACSGKDRRRLFPSMRLTLDQAGAKGSTGVTAVPPGGPPGADGPAGGNGQNRSRSTAVDAPATFPRSHHPKREKGGQTRRPAHRLWHLQSLRPQPHDRSLPDRQGPRGASASLRPPCWGTACNLTPSNLNRSY